MIDYVGGLGDLERRVIRSIGDPRVRFVEDPVRMLRAAVFGARLGFDLDELVIEAIAGTRRLILKASPARLLEETTRFCGRATAEARFRALGRVRLLELIMPELKAPPTQSGTRSRGSTVPSAVPAAPAELTNVVLIGRCSCRWACSSGASRRGDDPRADRLAFGMLPIARKDLERLRQLVQTLPRLSDPICRRASRAGCRTGRPSRTR